MEIDSEAVSRLERVVVMPTVGRLVELANLLDCDVTELLVEGPHISDQAQHLSRLLASLSEHDRTLKIEVVGKLTTRLAQP